MTRCKILPVGGINDHQFRAFCPGHQQLSIGAERDDRGRRPGSSTWIPAGRQHLVNRHRNGSGGAATSLAAGLSACVAGD
jgi:hypothetical protein